MSSPDNVYLNINIPGATFYGNTETPQNILAHYDQTLTTQVLKCPSEYYASVLRFSLPLDTIPIFSFPLDIFQNNPNVSLLTIGIETSGGVQFPIKVIFVPPNNLIPPTPAGSSPFFSYNDVINQYYYIFCVQCFIDMVNTALAAAVTASAIGVAAPFYVYNSVTQLISLNVTAAFIATGASIFLNAPLKTYFSSFNFDTLNNITSGPYLYFHNLATLPFGSPSGGPYLFSEEYNSLSLWFDIRKIIITTSGIPIIQEASPTYNSQSLNGTSNYLPIITDYDVTYNNINDASSILTYYPTAQYRLTDMNSNVPLTRIDLTFYWLSKNGRLYPIFISPNQVIELKLGFFKKALYKR